MGARVGLQRNMQHLSMHVVYEGIYGAFCAQIIFSGHPSILFCVFVWYDVFCYVCGVDDVCVEQESFIFVI